MVKKKQFYVQFYSDFSQLKYVFAEVNATREIQNTNTNSSSKKEDKNPMNAKIKILEDEIKIIEDSNLKFKEENDNLKSKINELNDEIFEFKNEIVTQKNTINQFNIDKEELNFLRLNLEHGHKCRKSFLNPKGFIIGSNDYKKCILSRGINNE